MSCRLAQHWVISQWEDAGMQSAARNVADYLDEVPAARRDALARLRDLCVSTLVGYEEVMEYGLPCYKKDGTVEVGFASQKNYIAIYILKQDVVEALRTELAGAKIGKGCIRYSKPEKLDFEVIEKLLVATRESKQAPC
jgi:uncharacterized protein YdhG (YjbR/CyaY superfamily)